jgi:hypothetical protein
MAKLTMALAEGIKQIEVVTVEHDGQTYEIEIRPLRHTEAKQIQGILSRGVKVNQKKIGKNESQAVEVDTVALAEAQYDAWLKAAALGTVDTEWTTQTIDESWKPKWIELVGEQVMELSGIESPQKRKEASEDKNINSFRKE